MNQDNIDETLGITRCVKCGHRLNGEIECPFCAVFPEQKQREKIPKWLFITACFFTSPLSLYVIIKTRRLNNLEKILTFSGCFLWLLLYGLWF